MMPVMLTLGVLYIGMGFNYFTAARGVSVYMLLFLMFIVWADR
jgi:phosphatidate cytidylyltransferase